MISSYLNYIEPTLNQVNTNFYDVISTSFSIKYTEEITWEKIEILEINGEENLIFFTLKQKEILLGSFSLNDDDYELLRVSSKTID